MTKSNDIIQNKKRIFLLIFIISLLSLFVTLHPFISTIVNRFNLRESSYQFLLGYDYTALFNRIKEISHSFSIALIIINVGSFLSGTYYQMKCEKRNKLLTFIYTCISIYLILGFLSSSLMFHTEISLLWKICLWMIVFVCLLLSKYIKNSISKDLLRHSGIYLCIYTLIITFNLYSVPNLPSVSYICFSSFYFNQSLFYLPSILIYIGLCVIFTYEIRHLVIKNSNSSN